MSECKIDISIQEEKHFGLKCVSLMKSYLNEYVVLEPLLLALKTILKNANLNYRRFKFLWINFNGSVVYSMQNCSTFLS